MGFLDKIKSAAKSAGSYLSDQMDSLQDLAVELDTQDDEYALQNTDSMCEDNGGYDVGGLAKTNREVIGPGGQVFFYIPSQERISMRQKPVQPGAAAQAGYSYIKDIADAKANGVDYYNLLGDMYLSDLCYGHGFPLSAYLEASYSELYQMTDLSRREQILDRIKGAQAYKPDLAEAMKKRVEFFDKAYRLKQAYLNKTGMVVKIEDRRELGSFLRDLISEINSESVAAYTMSYFTDKHDAKWLTEAAVREAKVSLNQEIKHAASYFAASAVMQHGADFVKLPLLNCLRNSCFLEETVKELMEGTEGAAHMNLKLMLNACTGSTLQDASGQDTGLGHVFRVPQGNAGNDRGILR